MIIFFSLGALLVIMLILLLTFVLTSAVSLNQIVDYSWICDIIFLVFHITIFIITTIMKTRTMKNSMTNKIIGNSLCFIGWALRCFTETIIFFCIISGYTLRQVNGDTFTLMAAFFGFIVNFGIFLLLLYASYKIDFLPAKYNDEFSFISIGIINVVLSIIFFLLCQFILAFSGQRDIITAIFNEIPFVKPLFFLTFLWLWTPYKFNISLQIICKIYSPVMQQGYKSLIIFQLSANRSSENDAFAGLVDGSFIASIPVFG